MSNLFDKISTLVNAQVNDLLGRNPKSPLARVKLDAEADKDPRRSAQTLRRRLEEAIDYEDVLQAKVDSLMQEALVLDQIVDETLRTGDEFEARRVQGQLNMKQQQLTMAESELRDHRLLTQHLMQELSTLEMALDSHDRRNQSQGGAVPSRPQRNRIPVEGVAGKGARKSSPGQAILESVSDRFNETRENLENLVSGEGEPKTQKPARPISKFEIVDEEPDPRVPKPRKKDGGDMNARLSRLSKPPEDEN